MRGSEREKSNRPNSFSVKELFFHYLVPNIVQKV